MPNLQCSMTCTKKSAYLFFEIVKKNWKFLLFIPRRRFSSEISTVDIVRILKKFGSCVKYLVTNIATVRDFKNMYNTITNLSDRRFV
jgi:hypothetical protein